MGAALFPLGMAAAPGGGSAEPAPAGQPDSAACVRARRCVDFLNSLGANSGISRRGESLEKTIECARYVGLRWFRSGYESDIPPEDQIELYRRTGARCSYGLLSGGADLARLLEGARQLADAGALLAIEGNNEPNNWGVPYQGERGGASDSWMPVARLQRDLYAAVQRDSVLRHYPVWSLSENGAQTDNVGLQFLAIPEGAGTLMPAGTRYADYANCHNYLGHPTWPGLHDNQSWIAADPGPECKVDGLYGNYGRTWRQKFAGYSEAELAALPRVTTESGMKLVEGVVDEEQQAWLFMTFYLAQFKRGWSHTAIYLLRDRVDEAGNQRYGLYRPDYTPRRAAVCLHNLTTILADEGILDDEAELEPGALAYSIPDVPATVHDLLLQKADGSFALVVWNERFASGGSDEVTAVFGAEVGSTEIYDPTVGTRPVRSTRGARSVTLSLSTYPLIIQLTP